MITETLHFENPRLAQQLFNNNSQNLLALEESLGVKAMTYVLRSRMTRLLGSQPSSKRTAA